MLNGLFKDLIDMANADNRLLNPIGTRDDAQCCVRPPTKAAIDGKKFIIIQKHGAH